MSKTKGCGTQKTMTEELLKEMSAGGMNRQQAADYFGITVRRLNQIFKEREDLLNAFNTGLAEGIKIATDSLMEKIKKGSTIEILFYLKCRAGWIEEQHRKKEVSEEDRPRISIFLPENGRGIQQIEAD